MTDLLHVIPDLPTKPYAHLLPSLENNLITTVDLLTLEPSEISKRARLPGIEVVKLRKHAIDELHAQLGFNDAKKKQKLAQPLLKHTGKDLVNLWTCITTLDPALDGALGGGIHTGYVTEIVGERYGHAIGDHRNNMLTRKQRIWKNNFPAESSAY